jgi:hypothetical protein
MTTTCDEYRIQKNYGGIWMNFGDVYHDLDTVKYHLKDLKGEFRIFRRTVTNWEEVKI